MLRICANYAWPNRQQCTLWIPVTWNSSYSSRSSSLQQSAVVLFLTQSCGPYSLRLRLWTYDYSGDTTLTVTSNTLDWLQSGRINKPLCEKSLDWSGYKRYVQTIGICWLYAVGHRKPASTRSSASAVTARVVPINHIHVLPKTRFPTLHFCRWQYGSNSNEFDAVDSESWRRPIVQNKTPITTAVGLCKVTQGRGSWYRSKARMRVPVSEYH